MNKGFIITFISTVQHKTFERVTDNVIFFINQCSAHIKSTLMVLLPRIYLTIQFLQHKLNLRSLKFNIHNHSSIMLTKFYPPFLQQFVHYMTIPFISFLKLDDNNS